MRLNDVRRGDHDADVPAHDRELDLDARQALSLGLILYAAVPRCAE